MKWLEKLIFTLVLVATAIPTPADIIWSGLRDTHIFMAPNEPFPTNTLPTFSPISVELDVNMDGETDVSIGILDPAYSLSQYSVSCERANSVARGGQYGSTIIPFPNGTIFDSSKIWLADGPNKDSNILTSWMILLDGGQAGAGPWVGRTGYMGLQFEGDDGTHFGWVQMTVYDEYPGMTIHDWAYESTPGEGIIAGAVPEPSSAILAILGATSVWVIRRQRQASKDWNNLDEPPQ